MPLSLRLTRLRGPMSEPALNATGRWRMRSGLLLTLRDAAGRFGQGEASPLPRFSPDDLDAVGACLQGLAVPDPPDDPPELRAFVAAFLAGMPDLPAARFGVETALLDLAARRRGVPFAAMLSDAPPRDRAAAALLVAVDPEEPAAEARAAVGAGARTLKIKLGTRASLPAELAALRAVRAAVGEEVALRLDLNRCLPAAAVRSWLDALAEVGPEFVEEPGPPSSWPSEPPVPLAADESLRDEPGLADDPRVAWLALKPTVLGGSLRALDLAERAVRRGARAYASHAYEGSVGTAAVAALATVLPGDAAAGLGRHPGLAMGPQGPPAALAGFRVLVAPGPGLGPAVP